MTHCVEYGVTIQQDLVFALGCLHNIWMMNHGDTNFTFDESSVTGDSHSNQQQA